jgi:hypothetical protein
MVDASLDVSIERSREVGPHMCRLSIGGVSIAFVAERDIVLGDCLERFCVALGRSDVEVQIEWLVRIAPVNWPLLFDSGCTWKLYGGRSGLQFDFHNPSLGPKPYKRLHIDHYFRSSVLQMSEELAAQLPCSPQPLTYPLDELLIMHRLTQEKAVELHGCGIVGPGGASNLFVGHSGAGKSTTTRLWTAHEDVDVLSDDRIIVRDHSGQIFMYGTPWHGEAAFASPGRAPLRRILILEHGRGNVLTRLSKSQAVAELFARSFVPFHRHEYVDSALSFLEYVADSVPCYRYAFEPEQAAVERILELRD